MSESAVRRVFRSPVALDAALACAVAVVAYRAAAQSLAASSAATPWIEDLLVPCTGRPGWVPDPAVLKALPQWQAFIERKIALFPCDAIAGLPLVEVGTAWRQLEYFHLTLGAWFRVVGPSLDGFVTFQSAFYAISCAIAYLVFRLGLWRGVALVCTAGVVWSKAHLAATSLPVEYAKAPWILATVWLCGLMLRRDAKGEPLAMPALAAGLIAGIGIGFKTDVLAAVPLALATTLIFIRRTPAGTSRKLVATVCLVAGVTIGGGAMIYRTFFGLSGSVLAVQFLGGQDGVSEALHAVNPLYDYGLVFDDSHITALLNSYGHRVVGTTGTVYFYSHEMQEISSRLLRDLWTTFPGDLVLRIIAATIRVLQLSGLGLVVALAGLFALFARDLRAGWFATVVTLYLSAYVSLVFQRRHFYHLEFISWWLIGFLAQAVWVAERAVIDRTAFAPGWQRVARSGLAAALSLALVGAAAAATLAVARWYQTGAVRQTIDAYLKVPIDERVVSQTADRDGMLLSVDGVSARADEPAWDANTMKDDYLVVRFACRNASPIVGTATFQPQGAAWNRPFQVPCSGQGHTTTLMLPIYQYGAKFRFEGLRFSAQDAQDVRTVGTMRPDPVARAWLHFSLPDDWQTRSWFKELKVPLGMP